MRHTYVEAEARREKQTSAGQGKQSEGARYTRGRIYEFLFAVSFSSHAKRSCLELHTSSIHSSMVSVAHADSPEAVGLQLALPSFGRELSLIHTRDTPVVLVNRKGPSMFLDITSAESLLFLRFRHRAPCTWHLASRHHEPMMMFRTSAQRSPPTIFMMTRASCFFVPETRYLCTGPIRMRNYKVVSPSPLLSCSPPT